MKLLVLCACAATALAANSAIDTMKPDAVYRPYGNHRGDLSDVMGANGREGRGAGFAQRLASSDKLECAAGKYIAFTLSGLKACFQCPAGKFQQQAGKTTCTDCAAGRYGTTPGKQSAQQACLKCPGSKYQKETGQSYCFDPALVECGPGHQRTGDNKCIACAPGRFADGLENHKCTDCPSNHYASAEGSSVCHLCRPGKFNDRSGATYCMWRGKVDILPPRPAEAVVHCKQGQYSKTVYGHTICANCPSGKYSKDTTCKVCPADTYNPWAAKSSLSACLDCPGATAGASHCTYHNVASDKQCAAGEFLSRKNEKIADSKDLQGNSKKANEQGANLVETCVKCAEGHYRSSVMSQGSCMRCPAGSEATNGDPASKYTARACAPLDYANGEEQNGNGKNRCNTDDRDATHWHEGATACTPCQAGHAWHEGICKKCPAGTYQHQTGAVHCEPCQAGTWSEGGAEFCSAKTLNQHCTGGRKWNPNGSPWTETCDKNVRDGTLSHDSSRKVARCECHGHTPFWDDQLEKCVGLAHCALKNKQKQCPAAPDCAKELKLGYKWVTAKYNTIKDLSGCLRYPCGIQKPLTGCMVPNTGRFVLNGWEGAGEGDDWCVTYQCQQGQYGLKDSSQQLGQCGPAPACSHLRCKFVAGAVKVKYDKFESVGIRHRCGHLDSEDPHNCMCTCFS